MGSLGPSMGASSLAGNAGGSCQCLSVVLIQLPPRLRLRACFANRMLLLLPHLCRTHPNHPLQAQAATALITPATVPLHRSILLYATPISHMCLCARGTIDRQQSTSA